MCQLGTDHFDRDVVTPLITGQVDGAHAALAEPGKQLITAELHRVAGPQWRRSHGGTLQTAANIDGRRLDDRSHGSTDQPETATHGIEQITVSRYPGP